MSSFEVVLEHNLKLVKIIATGEFFQPDGENMITVARTIAAQHSYNVIYDMRQATTTVPFASWFHMPRELNVFKNQQTKRVKAAVLASPNDKAVEEYKFYEIVTGNIGIKLRVFFDEEEAINWLNRSSN